MTVTIGRRELLAALGGVAVAWPVAARAQQPSARLRRIAAFTSLAPDDAEMMRRNAAFEQALQELGWKVGHNKTIEYRYGAGDHERMRKHAAELAALAPDVIFVVGGATEYMLRATRTVPIVFAGIRRHRRRLCREPDATGPQCDRLHEFRIQHEREMAGAAQRDCAAWDGSGGSPGYDLGIRSRAIRPLAGGRAVPEDRTDPAWHGRRKRDRAQCHEIRARAECRLDRSADRGGGRSSQADHRARGAT